MQWIFFLLFIYVAYAVYLYVMQGSLVYYPDFPKGEERNFTECPAFADTEQLNLDGTRAYYKEAGEVLVVVYHGNAGSACDRSYYKEVFDKAGYSYLFVEYAGYAGDTVKPSKSLILKDVRNVTKFLEGRVHKKVLLVAESIGVGAASYHTSLLEPDGLFFIASFDNLIDVARSHFPFYLYPNIFFSTFSNENYDNAPLLKNYEGRAVLVHGDSDTIIPVTHGRSLYDSLKTAEKKFITIPGADHNDIFLYQELWSAMEDFLGG